MSRLGVSINPDFRSSGFAPRSQRCGRRVRDISAFLTAEKSDASAARLLSKTMGFSLLAVALILWLVYN